MDVGLLYDLCSNYPKHLAEILGLDREPGPAEAVFCAFHASCAVVEFEYFDLDYRSEFSVTHETSFVAGDPSVSRVHFFAGAQAASTSMLRDFVELHLDDYKGYAIVRSQYPPTVGRSMVPPDGPCGDLLDVDGLASHIRTAVTEYVELFGVSLKAVGVPFMEQDGQLLRCSHVTGWMAHFSMVLRGVVPRRPSAAFNLAEDPTMAYGRSYPSSGLTMLGQSKMLSHLDLPPEVIDGAALDVPRDLYWYDRSDFRDAVTTSSDEQLKRVWLAENLTSTICRYLNSGIAAILNRGDHSQLVCGYLREEDMRRSLPKERVSGQTDVTAFLVHDDQAGPYRIVTVREILDEVLEDESIPVAVTVPLPRGLWLSGIAAERAGATLFESVTRQRFHSIEDRRRRERRNPGRFVRMRTALKDLHGASSGKSYLGRYAIRSYALISSDFKDDLGRRINDTTASRIIGYTKMSRYVWVVEIIDRQLRTAKKPAVVGTVALDGSAVSLDGVQRPPTPLLIHIPGQITNFPTDEVFAEDSWQSTNVDPYFSGRWNHTHSSFMSAEKVAARYKGASMLSSL